jgi:hypothetical protein
MTDAQGERDRIEEVIPTAGVESGLWVGSVLLEPERTAWLTEHGPAALEPEVSLHHDRHASQVARRAQHLCRGNAKSHTVSYPTCE